MKSEKFDAIGPFFSPHGNVVGSFLIKKLSCFKSSLKRCRSLEDVASESAMMGQIHVVCHQWSKEGADRMWARRRCSAR